MPRTCPACLWISGDEADECERCGESFTGRPKPALPAGAVGRALGTAVGLLALGMLAYLLWQRFGAHAPGLAENVKGALSAFYVWMLGPDEVFKPYLVIIIVVTLITWTVLWLMARLR